MFLGRLQLWSSGSGLTSPSTPSSTTPTGAGTPPWLWSKDRSHFSILLYVSNLGEQAEEVLPSPPSLGFYTYSVLSFQNKSSATIGVFTASLVWPTPAPLLELWSRRWDWSLSLRYFQQLLCGLTLTNKNSKRVSVDVLCWLPHLIRSCPSQHLPPIVSRFVPFAAVAAANCINIPFMRQRWAPRPPPWFIYPSRSCGHPILSSLLSQGAEVRYPGNRWERKQVRRVPQRCQTGHRSGGGVQDRHGGASHG